LNARDLGAVSGITDSRGSRGRSLVLSTGSVRNVASGTGRSSARTGFKSTTTRLKSLSLGSG
jgi:hypothetical protein